MKRILFIFLAAVMAACCCLCAVSCGNESCTHEWGEWKIIQEPTCADDGYSVRTCKLCGKQGRKIEESTDHTYSEQWSTDSTYHWHDITCGHSLPKTSLPGYGTHSFDENNVCTVCGVELVSQGLSYEPNLAEKTVNVSGIGNANNSIIHIGMTYGSTTEQYPIVGIKASAFSGLKGLASIYMRSNIFTIGDGAFAGCTDLTTVQLAYAEPSRDENGEIIAYQTLGTSLFDGCTALTTIRFIGTKEQWSELTARSHGWDNGMPQDVEVICNDGNGASTETEHTYGEWYTKEDASCSKEGIEARRCACGHEQTRPISKTEHRFSYSEWQHDTSGHWKVAHCEECEHEEYAYIGEHDYVDHTCTVCGTTTVSQGLEYRGILGTGTYLVSGIGTTLDNNVIIGVTYNYKPIVGIGASAFADCEGLVSVYAQSNIKSIGDRAFAGSHELEHVIIGLATVELGNAIFDGCESLQQITFGGTAEQWEAVCAANEHWSDGLDHMITVLCADGREMSVGGTSVEK